MAWTPSKGDTIAGRTGNYRITDRLGEGGFAVAWKAQSSNGRNVAIKHPNLDSANKASIVREYFNQELDTLQEIDDSGGHQNIIDLVDLVEDPTERGLQLIVVELIEGDELQDVIERRGAMSAAQVRRIGIELCDAMSFLHENEIIYRDLKPSNVMLTRNDKPILIDFNTAKVWDADADQVKCPSCGATVEPGDVSCDSCGDDLYDTKLGGDPFKPVEIAESQRHPELQQGPWSDVYSLGKMLMYMLDGSVPPKDAVNPHDFGVSCPDYMAEIIERSTERDYEKRYRNATVLKYVLEGKDPEPPSIATLRRIQTGETYTIHPGDTIGREGADGPAAAITIDDPGDDHISAVQVQFDLDDDGRWVLKDKSLNGTHIQKGSGWQKVLCEAGRERLRQRGYEEMIYDRDGNVPPETLWVEPGDLIALVDPSYGVTFELESTL